VGGNGAKEREGAIGLPRPVCLQPHTGKMSWPSCALLLQHKYVDSWSQVQCLRLLVASVIIRAAEASSNEDKIIFYIGCAVYILGLFSLWVVVMCAYRIIRGDEAVEGARVDEGCPEDKGAEELGPAPVTRAIKLENQPDPSADQSKQSEAPSMIKGADFQAEDGQCLTEKPTMDRPAVQDHSAVDAQARPPPDVAPKQPPPSNIVDLFPSPKTLDLRPGITEPHRSIIRQDEALRGAKRRAARGSQPVPHRVTQEFEEAPPGTLRRPPSKLSCCDCNCGLP